MKNEMYPCLDDQINYGIAITNLIDPKNLTLPLSLEVNSISEPNIRNNETATYFDGKITISNLEAG